MLSPISWSPPEIHILLPKIRCVPSSAGTARVITSPRLEPAWGSDSVMVPKKRPSSMGCTNRSTCSAVPWASSSLALATVRNAYAAVPMLAAVNHAVQAEATTWGTWRPPSSSSRVNVRRSASASFSSAAPISGISPTFSPSKTGSSVSLLR
jgi:hypothetical protein